MRHVKSNTIITNFDELFEVCPQNIQMKLKENLELRENPKHHPESSAFEHIKIVVNRLFDTENVNLILAGLFHDICKKESAVLREITEDMTSERKAEMEEKNKFFLCRDHEKKGADFALKNTNFIHQFENADLGTILWIVDNHMRIKTIDEMSGKKQRAMRENIWFSELEIFARADRMNLEWNFVK